MAITRTPIIDDDGTGTTGTIINNAWKTEFYNQIDAITGIGSMAKLYGASGQNSAAVGGVLGQTIMPALGSNDTVKIFLSAYQNAGNATGLSVAAANQAVFMDLSTIAGGTLANGSQGQWEVTMRQLPGNDDRYVQLTGWGGVDAAHTGIAGARANMTSAHWLTGGWTLQVYNTSQPAGASQIWTMAVFRYYG